MPYTRESQCKITTNVFLVELWDGQRDIGRKYLNLRFLKYGNCKIDKFSRDLY